MNQAHFVSVDPATGTNATRERGTALWRCRDFRHKVAMSSVSENTTAGLRTASARCSSSTTLPSPHYGELRWHARVHGREASEIKGSLRLRQVSLAPCVCQSNSSVGEKETTECEIPAADTEMLKPAAREHGGSRRTPRAIPAPSAATQRHLQPATQCDGNQLRAGNATATNPRGGSPAHISQVTRHDAGIPASRAYGRRKMHP